jgi:hypothetical protein
MGYKFFYISALSPESRAAAEKRLKLILALMEPLEAYVKGYQQDEQTVMSAASTIYAIGNTLIEQATELATAHNLKLEDDEN